MVSLYIEVSIVYSILFTFLVVVSVEKFPVSLREKSGERESEQRTREKSFYFQ